MAEQIRCGVASWMYANLLHHRECSDGLTSACGLDLRRGRDVDHFLGQARWDIDAPRYEDARC